LYLTIAKSQVFLTVIFGRCSSQEFRANLSATGKETVIYERGKMIVEVSRGHIKVQLDEKVAIVQGEMFFPPNGKMGFVIFKNTIMHWSEPNGELISIIDIDRIVANIRVDFEKCGNVLDVE
jgi:hypothetical protein